MKHIDPDGVDRWVTELYAPIPGAPVTEATVAEEMEAFTAFASAFGAAPPSAR